MTIIVRSHVGLNRSVLEMAEETYITGELVRSARHLLEGETSEPWMEHFEVMDDPPQNVPGRNGKSRPRIDIEFVETRRGRRPRFHVEAKRLYRSDSVNEYFGPGGLQMFVDGSYAADWPSGGMLGYIQSDDHNTWLARLSSGFATRVSALRICSDRPNWELAGWTDTLKSVRMSCHNRIPTNLGQIEIFHLLLECQRHLTGSAGFSDADNKKDETRKPV